MEWYEDKNKRFIMEVMNTALEIMQENNGQEVEDCIKQALYNHEINYKEDVNVLYRRKK